MNMQRDGKKLQVYSEADLEKVLSENELQEWLKQATEADASLFETSGKLTVREGMEILREVGVGETAIVATLAEILQGEEGMPVNIADVIKQRAQQLTQELSRFYVDHVRGTPYRLDPVEVTIPDDKIVYVGRRHTEHRGRKPIPMNFYIDVKWFNPNHEEFDESEPGTWVTLFEVRAEDTPRTFQHSNQLWCTPGNLVHRANDLVHRVIGPKISVVQGVYREKGFYPGGFLVSPTDFFTWAYEAAQTSEKHATVLDHAIRNLMPVLHTDVRCDMNYMSGESNGISPHK
ncbi:hypothetical protein ACFL1B_05740 [Nanoarchaeota archaeon]